MRPQRTDKRRDARTYGSDPRFDRRSPARRVDDRAACVGEDGAGSLVPNGEIAVVAADIAEPTLAEERAKPRRFGMAAQILAAVGRDHLVEQAEMSADRLGDP